MKISELIAAVGEAEINNHLLWSVAIMVTELDSLAEDEEFRMGTSDTKEMIALVCEKLVELKEERDELLRLLKNKRGGVRRCQEK